MKASDRWSALAVVASVALVVAAAALPWHRSGSVRRNAFALARVAEALGLVTGPDRRLLFLGVFALPLLAALALLAAVARRPRVVGMLTCAAGIVGLGSSAVILRVAGERQLGPAAATVAALVAAGCGLRLTVERKGLHG